ncbi:MAG: molybdenum cofactor synthesis domain-containing protein [Acidobacteriota bacterium]
MTGELLFVCTSERKGIPKHAVEAVLLRAGHGVESDAHAGPWHRQVSLLDEAEIETMRAKGLHLNPGAFGENLVVRGLDLGGLGIGSRLRVGEAELEITQIGKVCHTRCAIYTRSGDCIMPRAGLFARVLKGGEARPGLAASVLDAVPRSVIQAAVLTVSDRCAAGVTTDTAGPAVAKKLLDELAAHLAWTGVVADKEEVIAETLKELAGRGLDIILTAGGTGLGPRDVTPEATRAVLDREAPGLAEAMRASSARITPHGWLSRGVAGARGATLIVNLPGSEAGAVENLQAIIATLPHAVRMLRGDAAHPELDRRRLSAEPPPEPAG